MDRIEPRLLFCVYNANIIFLAKCQNILIAYKTKMEDTYDFFNLKKKKKYYLML